MLAVIVLSTWIGLAVTALVLFRRDAAVNPDDDAKVR